MFQFHKYIFLYDGDGDDRDGDVDGDDDDIVYTLVKISNNCFIKCLVGLPVHLTWTVFRPYIV